MWQQILSNVNDNLPEVLLSFQDWSHGKEMPCIHLEQRVIINFLGIFEKNYLRNILISKSMKWASFGGASAGFNFLLFPSKTEVVTYFNQYLSSISELFSRAANPT